MNRLWGVIVSILISTTAFAISGDGNRNPWYQRTPPKPTMIERIWNYLIPEQKTTTSCPDIHTLRKFYPKTRLAFKDFPCGDSQVCLSPTGNMFTLPIMQTVAKTLKEAACVDVEETEMCAGVFSRIVKVALDTTPFELPIPCKQETICQSGKCVLTTTALCKDSDNTFVVNGKPNWNSIIVPGQVTLATGDVKKDVCKDDVFLQEQYCDPITGAAKMAYVGCASVVITSKCTDAKCVFTPVDSDKDGIIDVTIDESGVVIGKDNCPYTPNPDQLDTDKDGVGDVCDMCVSPAELINGICAISPESFSSAACIDTNGNGLLNDEIPDANLLNAIQKALIVSDITFDNAQSLVKLKAVNKKIKSLKGIQCFSMLSEMDLGKNEIADIGPLSNLTSLETLYLNANKITDVAPLSSLIALKTLNLSYNNISNLMPLSKLVALKALYLTANQVVDIGPLSALTKLHFLELASNKIANIEPLSNLTMLKTLYLNSNVISDLLPISGLKALNSLFLGTNKINDISSLSTLTALSQLSLGYNKIKDIAPLSTLTDLAYLYLEHNKISDIGSLLKLSSLAFLNLEYNEITDPQQIIELENKGVKVIN